MTKIASPAEANTRLSEPSRREVVVGLSAATTSIVAGVGGIAQTQAQDKAKGAATGAEASTLSFTEIGRDLQPTHAVSPGHNVQILLRWGDALTSDAPAWNPQAQTAGAQSLQFGYDNDFISFQPLPYGSGSSERGLLCINHESTRNQLMFPGFTGRKIDDLGKTLIDVEMAAHGHTIVEVFRKNDDWHVELKSPYNRRITAMTEIDIAGPAAGHARMMTKGDPAGRLVLGTLGNCAGGETPWGTVLTAEENIHHFFSGDPRRTPESANHLLMGISIERFYGWHMHYPRFNVESDPHEPNRFGWIVEIDPYDPQARPVKRTALGRFRHEGAAVVTNSDGRVICYMGDDEAFQYIYKFVSRRSVEPKNRVASRSLLDDGTLFCARFNDDHTVTWMPLTWGTASLTPANGFTSQADVVIEARRAAALLGATPMDRPEDIEVNKVTNTVFVALTKNARRTDDQVDAANPRARNRYGHIMEIIPPGAGTTAVDHAATEASWGLFLLAGDPGDPKVKAQYHPGVSQAGWLSNPDNLTVDPKGRLWISTDGSNDFGHADGIWATDVVGQGSALTKHFFSCPIGAELTGPTFTPDGTTLFCSVQHPGDDDGSSFVTPITRWPDFKDGVPPRPSVIAIRTVNGKPIG